MSITSNPFATRFTRPGAIAYLFPPGVTSSDLVDRLAKQGWQGAIIGPHGSGKSTLLSAIESELRRRGRRPLRVTLHDGQRRLPDEIAIALRRGSDDMLLIDGYEQLSWWSRWKLRRGCRRQQCGLVVTAHAPVGLPTLWETRVDPQTLQAIVEHCLPPHGGKIGPDDLRAAWQQHGQNMREALFMLYDAFERRTQEDAQANASDPPQGPQRQSQ
jgi:energy-coupling factor transporter ATP-binding protein EcfA2